MANSNGWGDGASNNDIGWGQGADNAIGWGSIYADSWAGATDIIGTPAVDPDAQAFITAASITDPTQQSAINQLVLDLKGYGVWTKLRACYPMVGGSATAHSYNLRNTAQYQITWSGGITHSANGVLFGGVNGYGDTKLNPFTNFGSNYSHQSIYLRNNTNSIVVTGVTDSLSNRFDFGYDVNKLPFHAIASTTSNLGSTDTRTDGFLLSFRTGSTTGKYKRNNVDKITSLPSFSQYPSFNYYIGARNAGGVAALFNNQELSFCSIGDGLTDTEAANFYTAVQAFQTTLGRSIGTQTVSDADAQAFVTNAGIVDQVEANAINNLVIGLKADSLWTKMQAVYPFVGGSSSTMKYNLKNPLDTDAAFRLVFNGGWTFSSTGATPNQINTFASTKLNAKNILTNNNTHLSFYSRTSTISNAVRDLAAFESGGNPCLSLGTNTGVWISDQNDFNIRISSSIASATGFYTGTRTSSTSHKLYKNGSVLGTNTSSNSLILPNTILFLGAANISTGTGESASTYSNKEVAFASIGDGLTDTDATNLNNRVTTFQTALNRNV